MAKWSGYRIHSIYFIFVNAFALHDTINDAVGVEILMSVEESTYSTQYIDIDYFKMHSLNYTMNSHSLSYLVINPSASKVSGVKYFL